MVMKIEELSDYGIPEHFIKKFKEEKILELFPPQEEVVKKKLFKDKNLVISLPTAGGKTFIAALAIINKLSSSRSKAIYTVPLVALANEKYEYFKKLFEGKWKVAISVGDLDSSDPWLADYDVIVCTNEKLDSLIRHGAPWIKEIGLIVVDEIHLLNDSSRGPTLEILLTQLREIVPKAQILALSATISNAKELAEWLNATLLKSDFRPVKLYEGVYYDSKIFFYNRKGYELSQLEPEAAIAENVMQLKKQIMYFVATRKTAESLAEKLTKTIKPYLKRQEQEELSKLADKILNVLEVPTKQCKRLAECIKSGVAFHHAGLLGSQKRLIEENFRNGLIKAIVATPTLAFGVNLPSFRVVIRDAKRYYPGIGAVYIPVLDYKQMCGRCVTGDTILFTKEGHPLTVSEITSKYFKPSEVGKKNVEEEIRILSVDLNNFGLTFSKVLSIWKRKVKKIIQIETRSGKIVRLSLNHPVLTFRKTSSGKPSLSRFDNFSLYEKVMELRRQKKLGPTKIVKILQIPDKYNTIQHWLYEEKKGAVLWKNAIDLKKGENYRDTDYIASVVGFCNNVKKILPPTHFLPHEKLVKKSRNVYITKQGHKSCKFPSVWSDKLCIFIAKIMSDGSIYFDKKSNSYGIRYFNKNLKVHENYAKLCKELFGKKVKTVFYRGTYQSTFKSFLVGEFLKNIGIPYGKKSLILRIPPIFFSLPENLIKTFLKEYVSCDGWEDELTYNFVTCSEKLAYDLALLLSKIGMIARIHRKKPNTWRKRYMWNVSVTKSQFNDKKKFSKINHIYPDMIKKIQVIDEETYVFDLMLDSNHNFVANGIVVHNSGRPAYDEHGESVLIARTEEEAHELVDHFIMGQSEDIQSKLAVEPILRMHTLALIASNFCTSEDSLNKFFSKTFYAFQFGDTSFLEEKILQILEQLIEWKFVVSKKNKIEATRIGKRVSELYIDPLTAHQFIQALSKAKEKKIHSFGLLQLISNTIEMRPLLSVRAGEFSELEDIFAKREEELLQEIPDESELEFDDFLRSLKTALMFEDWIEEATEDQILVKYRVAPGEFYGRREIADWLVYSLQELALLLGYKELLKHIRKLRVRLEYGVKEELIPLVRLKQVGRIRARKLFNAGIKSLADLRKASIERISAVVGPSVAKIIKDQLEGKEEKKKIEKQVTLKKY